MNIIENSMNLSQYIDEINNKTNQIAQLYEL